MTAIVVSRIVSGGQSGADRAALDFAISRGVDYSGWCPAGGWAEDFPKPPGLLSAYPNLVETLTADPRERTALNVRDSDATLIVSPGAKLIESPGTTYTANVARRLRRPLHIADLSASDAVDRALAWLAARAPIHTLNIAGPRESEHPGVYALTITLLQKLEVTSTNCTAVP